MTRHMQARCAGLLRFRQVRWARQGWAMVALALVSGHVVTVAQTPARVGGAELDSLVLVQGDRRIEVQARGATPVTVNLQPGPFVIEVPNVGADGRPVSPGAAPIRVCAARSAAVFHGAAPGRQLGVSPCFNGASQMARAEDRRVAAQLMVGDGTAHNLFNDDNAEFGRGVNRILVPQVVEWPALGVRCPPHNLARCDDLTLERLVTGGQVHAVVWADLNGDKRMAATELWSLTLQFTGPEPARLAPDHLLGHVNGRPIVVADAAEEHRRAAASGRNLNLGQSAALVAEHLLYLEEALRLGLLPPDAAASQATDPAARRAARDAGVQAFFRHLGQQLPKLDDVALRAFYDQNPRVFARRLVFDFDALQVATNQLHEAGLGMLLPSAPDAEALARLLRQNGVPFERRPLSMGAESLPLQRLADLERAAVGSGLVLELGGRPTALFMRSRQVQPTSFDTVRSAIERYLLNQAAEQARQKARERLASAAQLVWQMPPP